MIDDKNDLTDFLTLQEKRHNDSHIDLTMFTITDLKLTNETGNMVHMTLKLKRKVTTELLTTYLPTILLLLITFTTIFFGSDLFTL